MFVFVLYDMYVLYNLFLSLFCVIIELALVLQQRVLTLFVLVRGDES